ncbi:MAG: YigZ family protein [Lachnospiraceae bacterium]
MENRQNMMILQDGQGEIVEKKSRFIARLVKADSEEQAAELIAATRKKYWDARHVCYAFVIGDNNEVQRFSDDGEPAGTAGKPILEVLAGSGVRNALLTVTRYFGGTLLGTGGLVRAYSQAAREAVDNAVIAMMVDGVRVSVVTDYAGLGKIQYMASKEELLVVDTIYTDKVCIVMAFEKERLDGIQKQLYEITRGQGEIVTEAGFMLGRDVNTGRLFVQE